MDPLQLFLADIWFFLAGFILALYVVLDGFDLGVGILSLFVNEGERHEAMMSSVSAVWDANETWLVVLGGALFGAFPLVYGVVLHGLYIPIGLMLLGLIFRGVAFEFHEHSVKKRVWSLSFGLGSLTAAISQGFVLGGLLSGIRVEQGQFAGGIWDWFNPFSILVAVGVAFGYALLGATYLILKTQDDLQRHSYRWASIASYLMLLAAVGVTVWTPIVYPYVAGRWFTLPNFFLIGSLPALALFAFAMLQRSLRQCREGAPFAWSLLIFLSSFIGLAISLYPYMVPPNVTLGEAASSPKTLVFMLVGIGMLIPVMVIYNGYLYFVFRGKAPKSSYSG